MKFIQVLNSSGEDQKGLYFTNRDDSDKIDKDIQSAYDKASDDFEDEYEIVEAAEELLELKDIHRVRVDELCIDNLD